MRLEGESVCARQAERSQGFLGFSVSMGICMCRWLPVPDQATGRRTGTAQKTEPMERLDFQHTAVAVGNLPRARVPGEASRRDNTRQHIFIIMNIVYTTYKMQ